VDKTKWNIMTLVYGKTARKSRTETDLKPLQSVDINEQLENNLF